MTTTVSYPTPAVHSVHPRHFWSLLMASRRYPYALLVGAAASWGIGTVLSKQALGEFSALPLLVVQLTASTTLLLVVCSAVETTLCVGSQSGQSRRARCPQPRSCLRARPHRPDLHHGKHISAAVGYRACLITAFAIAILGERPTTRSTWPWNCHPRCVAHRVSARDEWHNLRRVHHPPVYRPVRSLHRACSGVRHR